MDFWEEELPKIKQVLDSLQQMDFQQCHVVKYIIGHGELIVSLNPAENVVEDNKIHLLFKHTVYFEGPFAWQGAKFSMSPLTEHPDLMSKIPVLLPLTPYPNSSYYDYLALFQIESGDIAVKIVAKHIIKLNDFGPVVMK